MRYLVLVLDLGILNILVVHDTVKEGGFQRQEYADLGPWPSRGDLQLGRKVAHLPTKNTPQPHRATWTWIKPRGFGHSQSPKRRCTLHVCPGVGKNAMPSKGPVKSLSTIRSALRRAIMRQSCRARSE